jgi:hypothetical protein
MLAIRQMRLYIVGLEVFTAVVMKSIIFWDMMPCSHIPKYDILQVIYCSSESKGKAPNIHTCIFNSPSEIYQRKQN